MKTSNLVWGWVARTAGWVICAYTLGTTALLAQQAGGSGSQPLQAGVENLRGIVVVPAIKDVVPTGLTGVKGVVVKGPDFLRKPEFEKMLSQYLGAALTESSLASMQTNIIRYCRGQGHLVVDVFYSEQDVQEATIQVAVIEGVVGKILVNNEGRKWFSDSLVLRQVGLKAGDHVIEKDLNADIAWLNRNTYQSLGVFDGTFRDVSVSLKQGNLGETDVKLNVEDRCPVRIFGGIENGGIKTIGENRVFGGFNMANFLRLDHRLNYQYITDTSFDRLSEHIGSYVIPLPWKHEFTFFGAYAELHPDLAMLGPELSSFSNDGRFWQTSGRYSIPLPAIKKYDHEFAIGFDFKRTDTPLLFQATGLSAFVRTNKIDVAQFMAGYSGRLKDRWGGTAFSLQGFYSPGGLTDLNEQSAYSEFAPGTDNEYYYGRIELRRETLLPAGFSLYTRALGQIADAKLVATEKFSIGGYDTVRGYDERIVSGDNGWLLVNEIRTPRVLLGNVTRQSKASDWVQGLAFLDYGGVYNRNLQALERYNDILLSVGVGLRFQVADNFRVRFDYGWQLDREYANAQNAATFLGDTKGRAHFGLELSF